VSAGAERWGPRDSRSTRVTQNSMLAANTGLPPGA